MGPLTRLLLILLAGYIAYRYLRRLIMPPPPAAPPGTPSIEDTVQCPVCHVFVTSGVGACNRPDCPR
jgi:hypothetical protein